MISIVPLLTDLKLRLMHSFKVKSLRHPTFAPEGVAARTLTDHPLDDMRYQSRYVGVAPAS
jgi:hypothetical protein